MKEYIITCQVRHGLNIKIFLIIKKLNYTIVISTIRVTRTTKLKKGKRQTIFLTSLFIG